MDEKGKTWKRNWGWKEKTLMKEIKKDIVKSRENKETKRSTIRNFHFKTTEKNLGQQAYVACQGSCNVAHLMNANLILRIDISLKKQLKQIAHHLAQ